MIRRTHTVEEQPSMLARQGPQLGGQGEDNVEVVDGQDALDTLLDSAGLSEALALGAVAVAAGVVGGPLEVALDDLSSASREGRLREALLTYTHPHVLVVDEVGYLAYGNDAANVLFHVVNERHLRRRSMIFTTNKATSDWGRVLHDEDLGAAIVDRVLERGRLLHLDGPSVRTKHLNLDDPTAPEQPSQQPARVSGIDRPEFPEPTSCPAALARRRAK